MHKPHVTVAAIVRCGEQFLVVKERDKFTQQICYNQPAGHLEQNETLAAAAQRELLEETGLDLAPTALLGVYNLHAANGVHYLRFCFVFDSPTTALNLLPLDQDIISCHWYKLTDIEQLPLRSPLVLKCFKDSLIKATVPLNFISD